MTTQQRYEAAKRRLKAYSLNRYKTAAQRRDFAVLVAEVNRLAAVIRMEAQP